MTAPTSVITRSGKTYAVERHLAQGAQGHAYLVRRRDTGEAAVLKLFSERFRTGATRQRISALLAYKLHHRCSMLYAPTDMVDLPGALGHVAPVAPGVKLEQYMEAPSGRFLDHVIAAAAITAALTVLEQLGVGHGDLQAGNVMIEHRDGVLRAGLIDFDNLIESGQRPPSIGHVQYYAPEIRQAVAEGRAARPDLLTDRYAHGVLMHELLLARHPAAGVAADPANFDHVMRSGKWLGDPGEPSALQGEEGFPTECLDPSLQSLLRRALAGPRTGRPTAAAWLTALLKAAANVYHCDHCGRPCIVDGGKFNCVHCRKPFPAYHLMVAGHPVATLQRAPLVLGRNALGGDMLVSTRHLVLRRRGPDALLETIGDTPTYRLHAGGRTLLEKGQEHLIGHGERFLFGRTEATVEIVKVA